MNSLAGCLAEIVNCFKRRCLAPIEPVSSQRSEEIKAIAGTAPEKIMH